MAVVNLDNAAIDSMSLLTAAKHSSTRSFSEQPGMTVIVAFDVPRTKISNVSSASGVTLGVPTDKARWRCKTRLARVMDIGKRRREGGAYIAGRGEWLGRTFNNNLKGVIVDILIDLRDQNATHLRGADVCPDHTANGFVGLVSL